MVTPSYNQGRFIEETILSVLSQDYPNIEYIIIDGGSSDATIDILHRYESRLTWISEPDSGQSHAINKGFRIAKGEILCWLNSDDLLEPEAIRLAVDYMRSNPQVDMVYGEGNSIDEYGSQLIRFPYTRPFDLWALTHQLDFILQPTTFFRAEMLRRIGYVDESLHWCMDWDLFIRIGRQCRVDHLPNYMAKARVYSETKTSKGGFRRICEIFSVLHRYNNSVILPAYIIYGFGMISSFMQSRSARWYLFLRWLLRPVRTALWVFASNYQGVYQDGWLGRRAKFMFASGLAVKSVRFVLDIPDDDRIVPNFVTVSVNGRILSSEEITAAGIFEVDVSYDTTSKIPIEVTLYFDRALSFDRAFRRLVCKYQHPKMITNDV